MTVPEKGIIVALALLANLALGQSTITQTFTFGVVEEGARIIHTKDVRGPPKEESDESTITIKWYTYYPKERKHKIGAVVVHDHDLKKGGLPALYSGGPRAFTAELRLTTQPNHRMNMTVLIYGVPPPSTGQSCYHINLADLKD